MSKDYNVLLSATPIRVVLADDHTLVREGIAAVLQADGSLAVVGQASDGATAIELTRKLRPDVLLLDLHMPGLHGLQVLKRLHDVTCTRVLILSMHFDTPSILAALRNQAAGFVTKDCVTSELMQAIKTVVAGGQYLCESVEAAALKNALRNIVARKSSRTLSVREASVIDLAVQGKTAGEIATELSISRRTAEAHRANIMRKLGLKSQTDLVLYAVREGIVRF